MDIEQKKDITKKCSKNLINAAKSFLSDGKLLAAEQFISIAEDLEYDDEIAAVLAEIKAEKLKINSNEKAQDNTDKCFGKYGTEHSKYEDTPRKSSETKIEVKTKDFENKTYKTEQPQLLHAESNPSKLTEPKKNVNTTKFEEMNNENDPTDYLQPKLAAQSVSSEAIETLIRLANEAMKAGDFKKAVKFVLKAERSCSTDNGQKLLQQLLSSISKSESKHRNLNMDYVNADSGAHGVKYSSVVNSEKFDGNYKKSQYERNVEPAISVEHRIYSSTVSTSEKTITIQYNDLSINKAEKFTDSVTTVYRGLARECFKRGDFKETEYYLTKSQGYQFSSRVEEMLTQVKELNNGNVYLQPEMRALESEIDESSRSNRTYYYCEAENYLKKAQFALTAKKYDEAEELLHKAQTLRPSSVRQKALLADVREARAAAEKNRPHSSHTKKDQPSKNIHGSNTSNTSSKVHVPKTNQKKLSYQKDDVQCECSIQPYVCRACGEPDNRDRVQNRKGSNTLVGSDINVNRKEAENCFKKAQSAFADQDYDTAEQLVLEAQNLYPSQKVTEFLESIRVAKTENDVNRKEVILKGTVTLKRDVNNFETLEDSKRIMAEQYTDKAREAMSKGDFEKAERMLRKAERSCTTEQALELLDQIQNKLKECQN